MGLISIVIPVYNVESYLPNCLKSLAEQTCKDFEVIFVDDASIDASSAIIIEFAKSYTWLNYKLISVSENKGVAHARNVGIGSASNDYIYFLDSDDWIESTTIALFKSMIEENRDISFFTFNGWLHNIDGTIKVIRDLENAKGLLSSNEALLSLFERKTGAYLWLCLIKRDLFDGISFPEGSVWEDYTTMPYLIEKSKTIYYSDEMFYHYCIREASIINSFNPQMIPVAKNLKKMENHFFPFLKDLQHDSLFRSFLYFSTSMIMSLSREVYLRTSNTREANRIHKIWGQDIPSYNIRILYSMGKRKSAIFMFFIKNMPSILGLLYRLKILK